MSPLEIIAITAFVAGVGAVLLCLFRDADEEARRIRELRLRLREIDAREEAPNLWGERLDNIFTLPGKNP